MFSYDSPVVLSETERTGAVGDSLRLLLVYDDASFAKRPGSVITESGLPAEDFGRRLRARDALRDTPDQPASSHRNDSGVKPPPEREQFVPQARVTIDDKWVIVSARDIGLAAFSRELLDALGAADFTNIDEVDSGALIAHSLYLDPRGVVRHNDRASLPRQLACVGQRLAEVS